MRLSYILTILALFVFTRTDVRAQMADLSGPWNLDLAKSFLAKEHPNADYTLTTVIAQTHGAIGMTDIASHRSMMNIAPPDSQLTKQIVADGNVHPALILGFFPGMPAETIQVTANWQGNTLLIEEIGTGIRGASKTQRRFYLSGEHQLIELVEEHNTFGDTAQRLVFERQP